MSNALIIVFRLIHILSGVIWVGSLFFFVVFVEPSARALGPDAKPFMGELLAKRKVVTVLLWSAASTIAAGAVLYWNLSRSGLSVFTKSGYGIALTIGGLCAIVAFLIGFFGTRPTVAKVLALGKEGVTEGVPELQKKLRIYARTSFALLVITVSLMATGSYW